MRVWGEGGMGDKSAYWCVRESRAGGKTDKEVGM